MRTTLISHFWNEQYLLPWWIKHHRNMFDDAILIDWHSSDNSLLEITKHAPASWKVVKTRNRVPLDPDTSYAHEVDSEVMDYERNVPGWRMCLNTTEFLMGDLKKTITNDASIHQHFIGNITMQAWKPHGSLSHDKPLWEQKWMGLECRCGQRMGERHARSMHDHPVSYGIGRHCDMSVQATSANMVLLHYGNCIASPEMLTRRLAMKERITQYDRAKGWGHHHTGATFDSVKNGVLERLSISKDVRPIIRHLQNNSKDGPCGVQYDCLCSKEDWLHFYPHQ